MKKMIRKILFLIAPSVAFSAGSLAEDLLVVEYKSTKNSQVTRQWVSGAGEAIYLTNYRLMKLGRQPMFCPPETMRLMTENYVTILDLELATKGKRELPGLLSVADVLLDGLTKTFPCSK